MPLLNMWHESAHMPIKEFSLENNPKGAKGGPLLEEVSVLGGR
jgi:hypothetical protein